MNSEFSRFCSVVERKMPKVENIRRALTTPPATRFALPVLFYPKVDRLLAVKRFYHRCYMRGWIKANRDKQNGYQRNATIRYGGTARTRQNAPLISGKCRRWTNAEDCLLFSGLSQSNLALKLKRSITAIQRRKHDLRQKGLAV